MQRASDDERHSRQIGIKQYSFKLLHIFIGTRPKLHDKIGRSYSLQLGTMDGSGVEWNGPWMDAPSTVRLYYIILLI